MLYSCVTVLLHTSSFFHFLLYYFLCFYCSMGSVPEIKMDWLIDSPWLIFVLASPHSHRRLKLHQQSTSIVDLVFYCTKWSWITIALHQWTINVLLRTVFSRLCYAKRLERKNTRNYKLELNAQLNAGPLVMLWPWPLTFWTQKLKLLFLFQNTSPWKFGEIQSSNLR